MKAKAIAMSVLSSVSILGGVVLTAPTTHTNTVHAATVAAVRHIGAKYGSYLYTNNGTTMTKTGRILSFASSWKTFGTKIVNGVSYTNLGGNQWVQTVDLCINKPAKAYYVDYTAGYGIAIYNTPGGKASSRKAQHGTKWQSGGVTSVNGQDWIKIGNGCWINADYTSTTTPVTRYIKYKVGYGVQIYSSPAGAATGRTIKHGTQFLAFKSVQINGRWWTNLGHNAWIQSAYLSATKPSMSTTTTTGVTYRMTATAYDPRVLGNYTFGYDTVAANLSRFPRGTRLAITFANGTTKNYVVRDTGGFAYSNPNQLDIAMPNSQALQFGRQNITVRVLK